MATKCEWLGDADRSLTDIVLPSDTASFAWLDLSPISSAWTGTLAERCWQYLQRMLQTHRPQTLPAGQYYQIVLQTAMELDRQSPLPIWLLDWAVNDQRGGFETLIREALKWGLVAESVEWCRAYILRVRLHIIGVAVDWSR